MSTLDLSSSSNFDKKIYSLFKKICFNSRGSFNELINILIKTNNSSIELLVSNPVSRNTLNSSLFLNFCKIKLACFLVKKGQVIDEIIIDSESIKKVLSQISMFDNIKLVVKLPKRKIFNNYLISIINSFRYVIKQTYQLLIFRLFFKRKVEKPDRKIILIDTYAIPGFYSKDRYYNGLWDHLKPEEKKKVFFTPSIAMTKWTKLFFAFKDLLNSERKFLFKESYLKISDIFSAGLYPIKRQYLKIKPIIIDNIDYSPIIREEFTFHYGDSLGVDGIINYKFVKRLKNKNILLSKVIDWWENQALDKGFHKGLNDCYPDVNTVGYMGLVPSNMELQLYPTLHEVRSGILPKEIAVIGEGFIDGLKEFNSNMKVISAPAFRFQHLWKEKENIFENGLYSILVALPITFSESKNIISKMIDSCDYYTSNSIKCWIKPHPTMPIKKLKSKFFNKLPNSFEFTNIDTQIILRRSNILISGTSSICLEAISLGIPVLVINQNKGLKYNPIPSDINRDLWKNCNTTEDIINGINFFQKRNNNELGRHKNLAKKIKIKYFEPVSRQGVLKLLEIEGESKFEKN